MKKFTLTISGIENTDEFTVESEYVDDEYIIPLIEQHLKIYKNRNKLYDSLERAVKESQL